jgi:hypothetical protein
MPSVKIANAANGNGSEGNLDTARWLKQFIGVTFLVFSSIITCSQVSIPIATGF